MLFRAYLLTLPHKHHHTKISAIHFVQIRNLPWKLWSSWSDMLSHFSTFLCLQSCTPSLSVASACFHSAQLLHMHTFTWCDFLLFTWGLLHAFTQHDFWCLWEPSWLLQVTGQSGLTLIHHPGYIWGLSVATCSTSLHCPGTYKDFRQFPNQVH